MIHSQRRAPGLVGHGPVGNGHAITAAATRKSLRGDGAWSATFSFGYFLYVLPECDKTETSQGDARICQDRLHSSQRYVSITNSINQLNHLEMSHINDIINNINDQFSFEGYFWQPQFQIA